MSFLTWIKKYIFCLISLSFCSCSMNYNGVLNDIISGAEGLFYDKSDGLRILDEMRKNITTAEEMIEWYDDVNFTYEEDPLWSYLDFMSEVWVTVQKKSGDCDDTAALSEYILRECYDESCIMIIRRDDDNGHVIFTYLMSSKWRYIGTMSSIGGPYDTLEEVASSIFHDYSNFIIINRF